jgi:hypothetical protein
MPAPAAGRPSLLGIYLNDHLAGAAGGTELARRIAAARHPVAARAVLQGLAAEITEDRAALLDIMATLGIPARKYKGYAGWLAEKAGRLKPNGHLLTRSPLSSLEELEILRLGVEGKAAGWHTLRALAERDDRIDAARLDELLTRAGRQAALLQDLHGSAASRLTGDGTLAAAAPPGSADGQARS